MTYFGRPITSGTAATWDGDSFVFDSTPGSGGGSITAFGSSNAIYMAINGNDATGQRGNPSRPFLTLQAAANAAITGDTIYVGPGTFDTHATPGQVFTWPSLVASLSIVGSGPVTSDPVTSLPPLAGTLIQQNTGSSPPANAPMIRCNSTSVDITGFRLENLSLSYSNGGTTGSVLVVEDTSAPSSGLFMRGDGLVLRNISIVDGLTGGTTFFAFNTSYALNAKNVNSYVFENVDFALRKVLLWNCREKSSVGGLGGIRNVRADVLGIRLRWNDPGRPATLSGTEVQTFSNCRFNTVYLSNQARVRFDRTCVLGVMTTLSAFGILSYEGSNIVPSIEFYGLARVIDFGTNLLGGATPSGIPDTTGAADPDLNLDFSNAIIEESFSIGAVAGSTRRQKIRANGLVPEFVPGGFPPVSIDIGNMIDFYDRFLDSNRGRARILGATNGTITPGMWSSSGSLNLSGVTSIRFINDLYPIGALSAGLSASIAPYAVQVTGVSVAQGVLAVAGATSSGVTIESTPGSTGNFYVSAFWNATY